MRVESGGDGGRLSFSTLGWPARHPAAARRSRYGRPIMKRIATALILIGATISMTSFSDAPAQQAPAAYAPVLGDFMLATQTRHAKLWLAGNAQNWELADYGIEELKEGLESAGKVIPVLKNVPIGKMIESTMDAPIADVDKAIKAKNRAQFVAAFDKLTDACNSCHQAASRPFIVIQRPTTSTFANQSFNPSRK
jgi:hypothetical protein